MKAVITRVRSASVSVDGEIVGAIDGGDNCGLLVLLGVGREDSPEARHTAARKIAELRILEKDGAEVSAETIGAPILLVSQFTVMGDASRGRRPSWSAAAPGPVAEPVIEEIAALLRARGLTVELGQFGAYMQVESINDGPFTVLLDIK